MEIEKEMRKRYIHKQKYSECQLVSALNALIFFGKEVCNIGSKEYEELVDLVCARYGSAIRIKKAYRELGLRYRSGSFGLKWIENNLPVAIDVWCKKLGWHQILIIKVEGNMCYTTNFKEKGNKLMFDELEKIHNHIHPNFGRCRSFRLKRKGK